MSFQVKRAGQPIEDWNIKGSINPQITYSQKLAGYKACVHAGLDLYRWALDKYPKWFMADVIALNETEALIESNVQDAQNRKMESQRKKNRKR